MDKVNLAQKFALFTDHWSPKIVGELNGQNVLLAKLQGEFVWHHHQSQDEMFLVVEGRMTIELPDDRVPLEAGEFFIVPRGVDHRPVAQEEVFVLLFEPQGTAHTGNVRTDKTVDEFERI